MTQLDAPAQTGRRLSALDEEERYGCFVEGVMLRYLRDHVPRLGAVST